MIDEAFWQGKRVFLTGHTGFKGSWLSLWLILNNAKVMGISNNVPTNPSHFNSIKLHKKIIHKKIDIRNIKKVKKIFKSFKPDFVFHLAAHDSVIYQ